MIKFILTKNIVSANETSNRIGWYIFKATDPQKLREWYKVHLGIESENWGAQFNWSDGGYSLWSPTKADTNYFEPSNKQFMINFRVENLLELVRLLKNEGIETIGDIIDDEYGKFAWIMDPEGTKLELWEPPKN